jgi:hypothetical protein
MRDPATNYAPIIVASSARLEVVIDMRLQCEHNRSSMKNFSGPGMSWAGE